MGRHGLDRAGSVQGQLAGTWECGNGLSGSIKCGNLFLVSLLKKGAAAWSYLVMYLVRWLVS
jgi:hypothetical protein